MRAGMGTHACLLLSILLQVSAHSYLLAPKADWTNYNQPECRIGGTDGYTGNCGGPCGMDGNFFNPDQYPVTYARGQYVNMQWARNNHFSGFVRFTLVPKSQRMNFGSHQKFAFRYACWEAGKASCGPGEFCGTDGEGIKYTANVQIPPVYPDGEYVLGWSWYGGSRYFSQGELKGRYGIDGDSGHRSEYGDYFSCANVRIKGGMRIENEYKPIFETGQADRTGDQVGTCSSAVNKLFDCRSEPCSPKFPVKNMAPSEFDGRSPDAIKRHDLGGLPHGARPSVTIAPSLEPIPLHRLGDQNTPPTSSGYSSTSTLELESDGNLWRQGGEDQAVSSSGADVDSLDFLNTDDQSVVSSTMLEKVPHISLRVKQGNEHFSVRANTVGSVQAVRFLARLKNNEAELLNHKEEKSPYFLNGDESGNGKANAWQNVPVNNWIDLSIIVTSKSGDEKRKQVFLYLNTTTSKQR